MAPGLLFLLRVRFVLGAEPGAGQIRKATLSLDKKALPFAADGGMRLYSVAINRNMIHTKYDSLSVR